MAEPNNAAATTATAASSTPVASENAELNGNSSAPAAAAAATAAAAVSTTSPDTKGKKKSIISKFLKSGKAPETFVVHLSHPNGEALGMKIRSDEEAYSGVMISEVHPDGLAAKSHKIAVGQYLHQINGKSVAQLSHDDVVRALGAPELDLLLSIHPFDSPAAVADAVASDAAAAAAAAAEAADSSVDTAAAAATAAVNGIATSRRVTIQKADGEIVGLKLVGEHGTSISDISKDSAAAKTDLKVGDKILAVNDTDLSAATASEVVAAIKAAGNTINLNVQPVHKKKGSKLGLGSLFSSKKKSTDQLAPAVAATATAAPAAAAAPVASLSPAPVSVSSPAASATPSADPTDALVRNVTLTRGKQGLGMKIKSDESSEFVFVSEVVPGGAAEQSKQLSVGDHLIKINDISMRHAVHETVVTALQHDSVILQVISAADLPAYMASLAATTGDIKIKRRFSLLEKLSGSFKKKDKSAEPAAVAAAPAASQPAISEEPVAAAAAAVVAATAAAVAPAASSDIRRVTLTRSAEGLGMKIKSDDPKNGVAVYELTPGGVAASSGAINVGDVIVEVNGKSVMEMDHDDVVRELTSHSSINLALTSTFAEQQQQVQKRTVVINSNGAPYGLTLADANPGVRVEKIDAGSPATGLVNVNDYILAVNSHPTLTRTAPEVAGLLLENQSPELVLSEQWPAAEYTAQYRLEDVHVQAQEAVVRAVHQQEVDAAMSLEQAQRVTTEKMHDVQESLVRQLSRVEVTKAEAEEQARRVAEEALPASDISEHRTVVQEQLLHRASAIAVAAAEDEERDRRVTEDHMHGVQEQLVSKVHRKEAAAAELEEQARREAEANVASSANAALKHAVEAELIAKAAVHKSEEQGKDATAAAQAQVAAAQATAAQAQVTAAQAQVAAAQASAQEAQNTSREVAASASAEAEAAVAAVAASLAVPAGPVIRKVTIKKGTSQIGMKIAGSRGVRISEITPGGAAEQAGGLQVGDQVFGVNGETFDEKSSYEEVLAALRSAGGEVVLAVSSDVPKTTKRKSILSIFGAGKKDKKEKEEKEKKEDSPTHESRPKSDSVSGALTRTVTLKRQEGAGLGMQLHMSGKPVGEIAEVISDSPAAVAGVKAGERIVDVNGTSLDGKSLDELIALLKASGSDVVLVLQSPVTKSKSSKGFFGLGGKSDKASAAASPAAAAAAAAPPAAAASASVAAPASTSAAAAVAAPVAAAVAAPADESELQKEVSQLRFRLADVEMSRAAGEKRIQTLTTELNNALQEIAQLRAANNSTNA